MYSNVSFDGSPIRFRLDSPLIVFFDPSYIDVIRDELSEIPPERSGDIRTVLWRMNGSLSQLGCMAVTDFRPGMYRLDPRGIRKFGDEDDDLSFDEEAKAEDDPTIDPAKYQFAGTDSAAFVFVDFACIREFVRVFEWEKWDRVLRGDDSIIPQINDSLGGPHFAIVSGGTMNGMEFDGDGTYTIMPGAITPCE